MEVSVLVADVLAPVPITVFRSNSKFHQNLERSSLKCVYPITTKFCTHHDSVTVNVNDAGMQTRYTVKLFIARSYSPGWHMARYIILPYYVWYDIKLQIRICTSTLNILRPHGLAKECLFWLFWENERVVRTLIARFMGPTWGPSRADRTQMGPMLASWTLLSGEVRLLFTNSSWRTRVAHQIWRCNESRIIVITRR